MRLNDSTACLLGILGEFFDEKEVLLRNELANIPNHAICFQDEDPLLKLIIQRAQDDCKNIQISETFEPWELKIKDLVMRGRRILGFRESPVRKTSETIFGEVLEIYTAIALSNLGRVAASALSTSQGLVAGDSDIDHDLEVDKIFLSRWKTEEGLGLGNLVPKKHFEIERGDVRFKEEVFSSLQRCVQQGRCSSFLELVETVLAHSDPAVDICIATRCPKTTVRQIILVQCKATSNPKRKIPQEDLNGILGTKRILKSFLDKGEETWCGGVKEIHAVLVTNNDTAKLKSLQDQHAHTWNLKTQIMQTIGIVASAKGVYQQIIKTKLQKASIIGDSSNEEVSNAIQEPFKMRDWQEKTLEVFEKAVLPAYLSWDRDREKLNLDINNLEARSCSQYEITEDASKESKRLEELLTSREDLKCNPHLRCQVIAPCGAGKSTLMGLFVKKLVEIPQEGQIVVVISSHMIRLTEQVVKDVKSVLEKHDGLRSDVDDISDYICASAGDGTEHGPPSQPSAIIDILESGRTYQRKTLVIVGVTNASAPELLQQMNINNIFVNLWIQDEAHKLAGRYRTKDGKKEWSQKACYMTFSRVIDLRIAFTATPIIHERNNGLFGEARKGRMLRYGNGLEGCMDDAVDNQGPIEASSSINLETVKIDEYHPALYACQNDGYGYFGPIMACLPLWKALEQNIIVPRETVLLHGNLTDMLEIEVKLAATDEEPTTMRKLMCLQNIIMDVAFGLQSKVVVYCNSTKRAKAATDLFRKYTEYWIEKINTRGSLSEWIKGFDDTHNRADVLFRLEQLKNNCYTLFSAQGDSTNDENLEDFQDSPIALITNVYMLRTGIDIKTITGVFLADPVLSVTEVGQILGRAARPARLPVFIRSDRGKYVIGYIDKWAYKVYLPLESDVKIDHIDEALPSASSLQDFSRQDIRDEDVEKSYNTIKSVLGQLGKDSREAVVGVIRAGNVTPGKQSNKKLTTLTSFRCSNMENDGRDDSQSALLLTDSIITQISRRYAYGKQESDFFAALDKADDDFKKHGKLSTVETPESYNWHRNLKHQSIKNMGEQAYRERYPLRAVALDKKKWFSWDVASEEDRKQRDQETWIKNYWNYDWWWRREAKGKAQNKRTSSDVIANLLRGKRRREATEYDSISQICEKYLKVSSLGDISKAVKRRIDRHKASYQTKLKDLVPPGEFEKMRQEKRDNILQFVAICDMFPDKMPRFLIASDRNTWVDTDYDDSSSSSKPVHVLTCRNNRTFHDTETTGESDNNSDSQVSDLESDAVRAKRNKPDSSGGRCEGGSHPTDDEIQEAKTWRNKLDEKIQESGGVTEYKTKYPERGKLLSNAPWWTWPDEKRSYDCQYNGKTISITDERVQGARELVEWIKNNKRLPTRSDNRMKLSPDKSIESGHATWIDNFNKDILRKLDEAPFRQAKKRFQEYFPEVYDILKDDYPWNKVESKKQTLDEKCCEHFQTYMKWIDYQQRRGVLSEDIDASPKKNPKTKQPRRAWDEETEIKVYAGRALHKLRNEIDKVSEEVFQEQCPRLHEKMKSNGWNFSAKKWQD